MVIAILFLILAISFFPSTKKSSIEKTTFTFPNYFVVHNLVIYDSPSYLLLNNWVNESIWISTGIPEPNALLNNLPNLPPTITNLYVGPYGLLNFTLSVNANTSLAYLNLNNCIILETNKGNITILEPPYTPYFLILFSLNSTTAVTIKPTSMRISSSLFVINETLPIYILTNGTFPLGKGKWFIEVSVLEKPNSSILALIKLNKMEVTKWLDKSKSTNLPSNLKKEYYLSLLIVKDDQNPYLGTFSASPSPIYLYSWVRDSAFSALALQYSGHYHSALKYWLWLSKAEELYPGVFYTRYNFYNGNPDTTFGIPELDGIGLFEIGIYSYYNLTGNVSFLRSVFPTLEKIVEYQIKEINSSPYHLLPQDLSVWEDRDAYHFWTEAFNDLGLYYAVKIYKALGFENYTVIEKYEEMLNQSIISNFWQGSYFASALGTSVIFENGKSETVLSPEPPSIDSATLLPLDLGYLPVTSNYSLTNFETVKSKLTINGGLARFYGDDYHYDEYLYDSTGPNPPWIITTLFEALYFEKLGNYSQALNLMNWAYQHSQHGLLPEAVNPVSPSYPLPTTSPLTWSSAMFIIVALNYN